MGRAKFAFPGLILLAASALLPAQANSANPAGHHVVPPSADDAALFPRYPILDPNVRFWTRVFGEYPDTFSVVHWSAHPDIILRTLDMGAEASVMEPEAFRKLRNEREREAIGAVRLALEQAHANRGHPHLLSGEARRLHALLAKVPGDDRYERAAQGLRSQRGLKDRTRRALELSGRYLPYMESVFASYGLPGGLTRLPLVESSFNVDAYSKVGAAGLWQFMPASARIYMRLDKVVDDRRDPWASTHGAARHLRDDFAMLGSWPLALTAYNFGRGGVARGLQAVDGTNLADLVARYEHPRFGFASRNFYAEFLAAYDVERDWQRHFGEVLREPLVQFDEVRTRDYVPYETLRRIGKMDEAQFRQLNPAYSAHVLAGKLYVPPDHPIRVPPGAQKEFELAYASLGPGERFSQQRINHFFHTVRRGETLSSIAGRYGVSMASIRANNRIGRNGLIRIGQRLKIVPRDGNVERWTASNASASSAKSVSRTQTHRVRSGQTLSGIAAHYGVSQASIRTHNRIGHRGQIQAGQRLTIVGGKPAFRTHQVRSGQTLGSIARRYGVSVRSIRSANGLGRSSLIRTGQTLRVPVS